MAFKRTLVQRFFNISSKISSNQSLTNSRVCSLPSTRHTLIPPNPDRVAPDPGDDIIFRRFIHRLPMYGSPELRFMPIGENLLNVLRGVDIARERIQLDGLRPPATSESEGNLTVEDARKLLRLSQLEMVKTKLREIKKSCISYTELIEICVEGCSNMEQGLEFAKMLDESGTVIILGNAVFLRPDQVVKAIRGLMPVHQPDPNDPRIKELEEMEIHKSAIDKKAESLVRRELWSGLGYLVVQTAGFMRLTFWELTWDVMEPICFYVTSMYFMAGYAFFLRTSREPSFEGYFQSRFSAKQKRIMKAEGFDVERYNELKKICYPHQLSKGDGKFSSS
ncbi:hypothetical protein LguiB_031777 [Lonicera macranthoides]